MSMKWGARDGWGAALLAATLMSLFPAPAVAIAPEAGGFVVDSFSPETYKANAQNWSATQDASGLLYFANSDGVLQYDGSSWRKILIGDGTKPALSVARDHSGTIYVGSQGDFGYLVPDKQGSLHYVSLLKLLDPKAQRFGEIWAICQTARGVLFGAREEALLWVPDSSPSPDSFPGKLTVVRPAKSFGRLLLYQNRVYVRDGLQMTQWNGSEFKPLPGAVFDKPYLVTGVFRLRNQLTFSTVRALYASNGAAFAKISTNADALFDQYHIYAATGLPDGTVALGTSAGGVIFLSADGRLERVVDKSAGLASDSINSIFLDHQGGMWLPTMRGISHVGVNLPTTQFGEHEGLEEVVNAIERYNGTLYLGTMAGLSREVVKAGHPLSFERRPDLQGNVITALASTPHGLLVAAQNGPFVLEGDQLYRLALPNLPTNIQFLALAASQLSPEIAYASSGSSLVELHFDQTWQARKAIPTEGLDFRSVVESPDGTVWFAGAGVIWHVDFRPEPVQVDKFSPANGVAKGYSWVYRFGRSVLFASSLGILTFYPPTRTFRPAGLEASLPSDLPRSLEEVYHAPNGDIWISGSTFDGVLRPQPDGRNYRWFAAPLAAAGITGRLSVIYFDPDSIAWVSGSGGRLFRYDPKLLPVGTPETPILIRRVEFFGSHQDLFDGVGRFEAKKILYRENSLRFDYASPQYEASSDTQYQVRLGGVANTWSDWSSETHTDFLNIGVGRFHFAVRARDSHGVVSPEVTADLRVLAPWYRSWWAYLLYAAAAAAAVWGFTVWRLRALRESNRKLEAIVVERTAEITSQRDKIRLEEQKTASLLLNILPGPVADELRENGAVQPMAHEDITVCFTDFVGFTLSSERIPAPELVQGLHRYFTAFDAIMGRFGLEKLKTIGDSYMFVGGLPERRPSHAVDCVLAALEITAVVDQFCRVYPSWAIRVGIHSGPVVAGVVGVKKFAYDIWGETVNFASRFESSGKANHVNISSETYALVEEFIECEARGPVRIKEGRYLEMYFARGIRADLLGDDLGNEVPGPFARKYQAKFGYYPHYPLPGSDLAQVDSKSDAGLPTVSLTQKQEPTY